MTTQDYQELVQAAIRRGMARIKQENKPVAIRDKATIARLEYQRKKREAFLANGLTSDGKPRQRNYQHLTGWTAGEKMERERSQREAWNIRNRTRL